MDIKERRVEKSENKCFLSNRNSIRRCRYHVCGKSLICNSHLSKKMCNFKTPITLHNGCVCVFTDKKTITNVLNKPVYLYQEYNRDYLRFPYKDILLDNECKLIKSGHSTDIISKILKFKIQDLRTEKKIVSFFNEKNGIKHISKKLTKTHGLPRARYFYGVFCYYTRHVDKIIRLQKRYRQEKKNKFFREKYKNSLKTIKRIQIFYRYKLRKRKVLVKPMRMQYFREEKSISKIIFLQKKFRKFLKYKIERSHNCPYSLEEYRDIPEKYRVCNKRKEGKYIHWKYYHIKWLHQDWSTQTEYKRFVRDPITKREFDESFVENVAKKVWYLTRVNNDYSLNYDGKVDTKYIISRDWQNSHKRRSFYSFILLFYDMASFFEYDISSLKKIYLLRNEKNKRLFFYFSTEILNTMNNILLMYNIPQYTSVIKNTWNIISSGSNNLIMHHEDKISDISCGTFIHSIFVLLQMIKKDLNKNNRYDLMLKKPLRLCFINFFSRHKDYMKIKF